MTWNIASKVLEKRTVKILQTFSVLCLLGINNSIVMIDILVNNDNYLGIIIHHLDFGCLAKSVSVVTDSI